MKYCTKCGNELIDEAIVCPKCGCAVENGAETNIITNENKTRRRTYSVSDQAVAAKIFMVLTCVVFLITGFVCLFIYQLYSLIFFIPMFWCVPMTTFFSKTIKNYERVGVGFKVCTLLFVNVLSGIFMILDSDC